MKSKTKRRRFKDKDKIERLLWCDRHCCICEAECDVNIEFAHIGQRDDNNIDNAIPVCYDCHAKIGKYNADHPRGNKFKIDELKKRREQIYEKYTSRYVAPLQYVISNLNNPYIPESGKREYPDVTFNIVNHSDQLPTQMIVAITGKLNGEKVALRLTDGLYSGKKIWNLNPKRQVNGHFVINSTKLHIFKDNDLFEVRVNIKLKDIVGKEHVLLEDGYVYNHKKDYWYFEP